MLRCSKPTISQPFNACASSLIFQNPRISMYLHRMLKFLNCVTVWWEMHGTDMETNGQQLDENRLSQIDRGDLSTSHVPTTTWKVRD
jgi:hypothetical protein